jgi:hypothetical protein
MSEKQFMEDNDAPVVSTEPNIIDEHKGVKIALTPDYKFVAVASERFNDKKYNSLNAIKKAINAHSTNNKLLVLVRGIAEMNLHSKWISDSAGDDAITANNELIEQARDIIAKR